MVNAHDYTLSIVIAVYNREHLILRTLNSIAHQSFPKVNIIVVDNHSTDATVRVVENWAADNCGEPGQPRIRILHQPIRGAAAARNLGLRNIDSEFTMFFDSDDMLLPDAVESILKVFSEKPSAQIVAWPVICNFLDNSKRLSKKPKPDFLEQHLIHSTFATQNLAVRTLFALEAGNWDINLLGWNDWEFSSRLLLNKPVIAIIDKPLAMFYRQEESITGLGFSPKAGVWEKSISKFRQNIENSGTNNKNRLIRLTYYRAVILAAHYYRENTTSHANALLSDSLRHISSPIRRFLYKIIYYYTAAGFRGAYTLFKPFL